MSDKIDAICARLDALYPQLPPTSEGMKATIRAELDRYEAAGGCPPEVMAKVARLIRTETKKP